MTAPRRPRLSGERRRLSPFVVTGAGGEVRPRDQRDLMERPFFSLAKTRRVIPILYEAGGVRVEVYGFPEHGMATIWDADVLIWAASQIVDAENHGLTTSRFLRFTPYQLLTAIGRQTGARDYRLLKGALARLQSTVIRTTIRHGEHWRQHQFSWIGEWEEMTTAAGRVEGMEFVLPEWFYRGVLDRSLILTIDPAYFRLKGGIERWLYRVARKHAGRQPQGWCFDIPHLHAKSGSLAKPADFACDIRRIAARQPAVAVFTLDDYVDTGIMSRMQAEALRLAVATRANILVAGGTSTGKTTLTNALLAEVVKTLDRVVIIEDTRELQCAAPNLVAMRTKDGVATLSDLVRSSLRLRPDRIPIGEVRGAEALDLLKAWGTGHPGGIGTIHAGSGIGALRRLEQLIQEAVVTVPRALIAETVDLIAVLAGRGSNRRLTELVRVEGLRPDGEYRIAPVIPDTETDTHQNIGDSP
ncbi:ATPase, T2SS/T4P/T4SS family [Paracoccus denitrificans]|uniref:ATPase, T2SS/T4P/T4SS family n=1 Tax=Paracoccus denitrificans TaxID=266 RepID=UPI0039BFE45C